MRVNTCHISFTRQSLDVFGATFKGRCIEGQHGTAAHELMLGQPHSLLSGPMQDWTENVGSALGESSHPYLVEALL